MEGREYSEPFAVEDTYVEDIECQVRDGNFFLTYLREIDGNNVVVDRVHFSVKRVGRMHEKFMQALRATEPAPDNVISLVR